jgi:hypothetical protein
MADENEDNKVITSLTPEQEALLPVYRDRFIAKGLATGPCARPAVEAACKLAYEQADMKYPGDFEPRATAEPNETNFDGRRIFWFADPVQGREKAKELDPTSDWRCAYGSHEASWLAFHAYMGEVLNVKGPEKLTGLQGMLGCGWWWAYDEAVILTELPSEIHLDDRGRLHRVDGPAIRYPDRDDGTFFGVWVIHGVTVDKSLLENPITVDVIKAQNNSEVRRELINLYPGGNDGFLADMGAQLINEDAVGKLYRVDFGNGDTELYVRLVNSTPEPDGTYKVYIFRVDPECRPLQGPERFGAPQPLTARNATASMYGLRGEQYAPVVES